MATDTRTPKPLTVAELSEAIADGCISYSLSEDDYEISALDIRRFRRERGRNGRRALSVDPYLTSEPSPETGCQL